MYERNAIVLERYFYQIFDFKSDSNLKQNYENYRKLFECYGNLCDAKEKEQLSKEEFNNISKEISKLQKSQEKLYNKGTKFEYSRYVIFNNITEPTENIEKHLKKVNEDVQKNSEELKDLGEKFVQAVIDYNKKENELNEAINRRENAQKDYDKAYSKAKECYSEITEEKINLVKEFINSDNKENKKELQATFEDNGKKEKNPFDQDVILNTINKSIEIYKNEMDVYLAGYDRIEKLFEEIETDSVKNDKHTKYYRDSKAKVDFLNAEKDYIIQFLDNERMGAIYDKKVHRKLMLEACKKFVLDFVQINSLYEIILKEVAGRSTKKIYKENYNKKYMVELENSSIEPSLDTGKMRQEAIAFVNLNYWRVEGMTSIYNSFENIVTEIYGKDLSEFIPEELKQKEEEVIIEEIIEDVAPTVEDIEVVEEVEEQKNHLKVYYSSKIALANAIYRSLQSREFATSEEDIVDEVEDIQEEQYSIPENVTEIISNDIEEIEESNEVEIQEEVLEEIDESEEYEISEVEEENYDSEKYEILESDEENFDSDEEEVLENVEIITEFDDDDEFEEDFDLSKIDEIEDDESLDFKENLIFEEDIEETNEFDLEEDEIGKSNSEKFEINENNNEGYEIDEENSLEFQIDEDSIEIEDEEEYDIDYDESYEEDEEATEESILEIYYSENNKKEEKKNKVEEIKKKSSFFKKLVGFNSKEKKKA